MERQFIFDFTSFNHLKQPNKQTIALQEMVIDIELQFLSTHFVLYKP